MCECVFEEIEICPHCEHEFVFRNVLEDQYKVVCPVCGAEMMLCNKCFEKYGICDWHKTLTGGKCMKGETNVRF